MTGFTGTQLNILLTSFQNMYKNFIVYPPSIYMETQATIDKLISEENREWLPVRPTAVGTVLCTQRLQHIKMLLQNNLSIWQLVWLKSTRRWLTDLPPPYASTNKWWNYLISCLLGLRLFFRCRQALIRWLSPGSNSCSYRSLRTRAWVIKMRDNCETSWTKEQQDL